MEPVLRRIRSPRAYVSLSLAAGAFGYWSAWPGVWTIWAVVGSYFLLRMMAEGPRVLMICLGILAIMGHVMQLMSLTWSFIVGPDMTIGEGLTTLLFGRQVGLWAFYSDLSALGTPQGMSWTRLGGWMFAYLLMARVPASLPELLDDFGRFNYRVRNPLTYGIVAAVLVAVALDVTGVPGGVLNAIAAGVTGFVVIFVATDKIAATVKSARSLLGVPARALAKAAPPKPSDGAAKPETVTVKVDIPHIGEEEVAVRAVALPEAPSVIEQNFSVALRVSDIALAGRSRAAIARVRDALASAGAAAPALLAKVPPHQGIHVLAKLIAEGLTDDEINDRVNNLKANREAAANAAKLSSEPSGETRDDIDSAVRVLARKVGMAPDLDPDEDGDDIVETGEPSATPDEAPSTDIDMAPASDGAVEGDDAQASDGGTPDEDVPADAFDDQDTGAIVGAAFFPDGELSEFVRPPAENIDPERGQRAAGMLFDQLLEAGGGEDHASVGDRTKTLDPEDPPDRERPSDSFSPPIAPVLKDHSMSHSHIDPEDLKRASSPALRALGQALLDNQDFDFPSEETVIGALRVVDDADDLTPTLGSIIDWLDRVPLDDMEFVHREAVLTKIARGYEIITRAAGKQSAHPELTRIGILYYVAGLAAREGLVIDGDHVLRKAVVMFLPGYRQGLKDAFRKFTMRPSREAAFAIQGAFEEVVVLFSNASCLTTEATEFNTYLDEFAAEANRDVHEGVAIESHAAAVSRKMMASRLPAEIGPNLDLIETVGTAHAALERAVLFESSVKNLTREESRLAIYADACIGAIRTIADQIRVAAKTALPKVKAMPAPAKASPDDDVARIISAYTPAILDTYLRAAQSPVDDPLVQLEQAKADLHDMAQRCRALEAAQAETDAGLFQSATHGFGEIMAAFVVSDAGRDVARFPLLEPYTLASGGKGFVFETRARGTLRRTLIVPYDGGGCTYSYLLADAGGSKRPQIVADRELWRVIDIPEVLLSYREDVVRGRFDDFKLLLVGGVIADDSAFLKAETLTPDDVWDTFDIAAPSSAHRGMILMPSNLRSGSEALALRSGMAFQVKRIRAAHQAA